jgi:hypothetical protein
MAKAERSRPRSARERVAAQRASARRAERKKRMLFAGGGISLVLILAIVLVVVRPGSSTPAAAPGPSTGSPAQAAAVTQSIAGVPAATFNSVGKGTATGLTRTSGQQQLTSAGKPEVLYLGGEFCPFCAAQRWALTAALSHFGTFSGLNLIHSSPTDVYPSTPTLSYHQSSFTSKYVSFTSVEWFGEAEDASSPFGHALLDQPTAQEQALFTKYGNGSIPFVDIGNQYTLPQAQYLPSALHGMTWSQVASAMRDPASPVAKDIDGAANILTASICTMTHGQPGNVCASPGVTAAAASLAS